MAGNTRWLRWGGMAAVAAALGLLGGCVMAPVEPWEIGDPVVTSGAVYYDNGYYASPYYSPYYYTAPSLSLWLSGQTYRGTSRGYYRPGHAHRGHAVSRPHRPGANHRPVLRPRTGSTPRTHQMPRVGTTPRTGSNWSGGRVMNGNSRAGAVRGTPRNGGMRNTRSIHNSANMRNSTRNSSSLHYVRSQH